MKKTIKKIMIILVALLTMIPYSAAYVLSYLLKMKDREDMLTPAEWIALYKVYEVGSCLLYRQKDAGRQKKQITR